VATEQVKITPYRELIIPLTVGQI